MPTKDIADSTVMETVAPEHITLDEFCMRLSKTDKRVEMIGAFNYVETQAGRFKDAEQNYQTRFQAFVNKPV
jgi:hypothetical protein